MTYTASAWNLTVLRRRADDARTQLRAASLTVARHSTSPEDCRELLVMLGLLDDNTTMPIPREREAPTEPLRGPLAPSGGVAPNGPQKRSHHAPRNR